MENLSPREAEVLGLLARGYLYKEIGETMGISYATVHTHIRHIYEKLHVRSRTEAVARHFGHGVPDGLAENQGFSITRIGDGGTI